MRSETRRAARAFRLEVPTFRVAVDHLRAVRAGVDGRVCVASKVGGAGDGLGLFVPVRSGGRRGFGRCALLSDAGPNRQARPQVKRSKGTRWI